MSYKNQNFTVIDDLSNITANNITSNGVLLVSNTTQSTNSLTGAFISLGGVGISGNVFVERNISSNGNGFFSAITTSGMISANGSLKAGRNATQYILMSGSSLANFLTGVSDEGNPKPLRIRADSNSSNVILETLSSNSVILAPAQTTILSAKPNGQVEISGNLNISNTTSSPALLVSGTTVLVANTNSSSNISAVNLFATNNVVSSNAISTNIFSSSITTVNLSASGNTSSANLSTTNIIASGNVNCSGLNVSGVSSLGSVFTNSTLSVTGNSTFSNVVVQGILVSGNVVYSNSSTVNLFASGNVIAGNVISSGLISVPRLSVSGNVRINANSSDDAVRITQTGTGNCFVVEDSTSPDSNPFLIDNSGRVLIGFPDSINSSINSNPFLQLSGLAQERTAISHNYFANNAVSSYIIFNKSRSSNVGGFDIIVNDGDEFGSIFFDGSEGTGVSKRGAAIRALVDGTPGVGSMPGSLDFRTTPSGSGTSISRLSIGNTGIVSILSNIPSTSTTNGSLVVTGGIGVSGNVRVAQSLSASNTTINGDFIVQRQSTSSQNFLIQSIGGGNIITTTSTAGNPKPFIIVSDNTSTGLFLRTQTPNSIFLQANSVTVLEARPEGLFSSDQVKINGEFVLGSGSSDICKEFANSVTTTSNTQFVADSWDGSNFDFAKYIIKAESATNIHASELMVGKDAANNIYISEFGVLRSSADLFSATADFSSPLVRLLLKSVNNNTISYKIKRTLL